MTTHINDLSKKRYSVTVLEIRRRIVQGDEFTGDYNRTVTLSDGTQRPIRLRPVMRDGLPHVEINTGGATTYFGIIPLRSGGTTHGSLLVRIDDLDDLDRAHDEWRRRMAVKHQGPSAES